MDEARILKTERSDARERHRANQPVLAPEYPSLTATEVTESASTRLAKSKRRFDASSDGTPNLTEDLARVLGDLNGYTHSSSSALNEWLRGWSMPTDIPDLPENQTSKSVYVGIADSVEMPYVSPLHKGVPFVTLTSGFVELCWRLSEVFPAFGFMVKENTTEQVAEASRTLLFDHLGLSESPRSFSAEIIRGTRDQLFSERSTAAAIRWAVGHEMAHAVGTKQQRTDAFKRAERLLPGLEETQWLPKSRRGEIEDLSTSVQRYKDEIACDLLASQYVLDSPFATDDLVTQICGSLLALEALIIDGFRQDGSAVSQTHPSPSLRFQIVFIDWMETILKQSTWHNREYPGEFGLQDIAYWMAFERWAAGRYRPHRSGACWQHDIDLAMEAMLGAIPLNDVEQIYVRQGEVLARIPRRSYF